MQCATSLVIIQVMETQIIARIGIVGIPESAKFLVSHTSYLGKIEGSDFERVIVLTLSLKIFRRKSLGTSSGSHVRTLDEVAR